MDVRTQILEVATGLFAQRGFDGTSLQAIAEQVGIRKPSLLYHFRSKDVLRRHVLEHMLAHWADVLPRVLGAVRGGRERFEALTQELVRFFEADPDRARLLVRELLDRPEDMRERLRTGLRPWLELLADAIRQGQSSGEIRRDVDPEAYLVHVVTLAVCGVAARECLNALIDERDADARRGAELVRLADVGLFPGRSNARAETEG